MSKESGEWLSLGGLCVVILISLAFFFSQVITYAG